VGRNVAVGDGVKLSIAGWKGVGVALAFGSTVTRLRGAEDIGGYPVGRVQEAKMNVKRDMKSAQLRITKCALRIT
jgi:hypothetical protein